jgi:O-acetyl-ADP-ribose deacetylase (regulator of RNase III)/uncharacterized protein YwgA
MSNVQVREGDLLKSGMHALVNTVNTVGVMGKGVAMAFKKRYPAMYVDYVRRCDKHEVKLGEPYPYEADDHLIINFPTKQHWRSSSQLDDIVAGLKYLERHYKEWNIRSLAVPPLGCGNGQLDWRLVRPVLLHHLRRLDIPVELYAPHVGSLVDATQLELLGRDDKLAEPQQQLAPWTVAVAKIVHELELQRYHWPAGRATLRTIVYFATVSGLPTGLEFTPGSFGPYAPDLKAAIGRMQHNGLIVERPRGRMFEVISGPSLENAQISYEDQLEQWSDIIDSVADLAARFSNREAEVVAAVHFKAIYLGSRLGRNPNVTEVISAVDEWKHGRLQKITRDDILQAVVNLGTSGWLTVEPDSTTRAEVANMVGAVS